MNSSDGLLVMTALPPTKGHGYLIDFATQYLKNIDEDATLYVVLCSRDQEPYDGWTRIAALTDYADERVQFVNLRGEVPQDPSEHPDFWNVWRELLNGILPLGLTPKGGILFASDLYGIDLAREIGYEFIPCNTYREVVPVSATVIRHDPITNFSHILPTFQPYMRRTVTFFGAESVGKTTVSRSLAKAMNAYWVPEWAREVMEVKKHKEVTSEVMTAIEKGQGASQAVVQSFRDRPFIFQDTDLLSTIGYHQIWGGKVPDTLEYAFLRSKADLYILMNDQIPFEPDPLRFGGSKRESNNAFWINLLKKYDCKYHIVHSTYKDRQEDEIMTVIRNDFLNGCDGLGVFLRSNQESLASRQALGHA